VNLIKVVKLAKIANNIKIAFGAVFLHSFLEEEITIGGIPARKIKQLRK
jgi:serine acetyltransferase